MEIKTYAICTERSFRVRGYVGLDSVVVSFVQEETVILRIRSSVVDQSVAVRSEIDHIRSSNCRDSEPNRGVVHLVVRNSVVGRSEEVNAEAVLPCEWVAT